MTRLIEQLDKNLMEMYNRFRVEEKHICEEYEEQQIRILKSLITSK